jgi:hypothetical protein
VNLAADDSAVLTELPSFKAYAKDITARCETAPEVTRLGLDLLDSYGLSTVTRMEPESNAPVERATSRM